MWEMASVFEKRLKYVGNDVYIWEMAKIYGTWLKYLTNGSINWEMTERFGNRLRYLGNGLDICGARFKYLTYGISMFQMTKIS